MRQFFTSWLLLLLFCGIVSAQATLTPVASWRFDRAHFEGGKFKALSGPDVPGIGAKAEFVGDNDSAALVLGTTPLTIADPHTGAGAVLPREALTVAVWVSVDEPLEWGGLFGAIHDNGADERGWLLGLRHNVFSFAVASEATKKLTYLEGKTAFEKGRFYHVAGTYDGKTMRLYVNGALDGESTAQSGPILQPVATPFVLGAYRDSDEFHPTSGRLREAALYHEALTPEQVRALFQKEARLAQLPPQVQPVRPSLAIPPAQGWKPQLTPFALTPQLKAKLKTRNVIFISTDGLRWQDVFRGAQEDLLTKDERAKKAFWRATPEERRATLMPFFWSTIAKQGQLWGNRDKGSECGVTNGKNFSYPGYSEFLTGHADDRINSNAAVPNPNLNVLEWLNGKPAFKGKVLAANNWDVLPSIMNRGRNKLPMWTWNERTAPNKTTPRLQLIEDLIAQTPSPWGGCHYDSFVYQAARELLQTRKPRVSYVNFGETDEWAHAYNIGEYLRAANRVDGFVQGLWELAQSLPEYKGNTTLIVTTDHGRGRTIKDWGNHSAGTEGSGEMWMAILGPDTPALGERSNAAPVAQGQVAATLAAFLGEDWPAAEPLALPAIAEAF